MRWDVLLLNNSGTKAFAYDSIRSIELRFEKEDQTAMILTLEDGLSIRFDEFEKAESAINFLLESVKQINEYKKGR